MQTWHGFEDGAPLPFSRGRSARKQEKAAATKIANEVFASYGLRMRPPMQVLWISPRGAVMLDHIGLSVAARRKSRRRRTPSNMAVAAGKGRKLIVWRMALRPLARHSLRVVKLSGRYLGFELIAKLESHVANRRGG